MMKPASHVIEKCGGLAETARLSGRDRSRVSRWCAPKERGGSGGLIPSDVQPILIANARSEGIDLRPDDFFDPALLAITIETEANQGDAA